MTRVTIAQPKVRLVDPHDCTDEKDVLTVLHAVFDTLIEREGSDFKPGLATEWTVSDDARVWQFTLRPDAMFHDGSPVTADAVVASLQRMARPDMGKTLGASGVWHQYLGGAQITAGDAARVRIALAAPVADLLDILVQGFIADPATFDRPLPNGTGPYSLTAVEHGQIEATRVDTHPGATGPRHIVWRAEPDPEIRRAMVEDGAAQIATALPLPSDPKLEALHNITYENPVAIIYLLNARSGALSDARVRKALNLAIDRGGLIAKARTGAAKPLHAILPALSLGAAAFPPHDYDPDAARALLAEAGFSQGLTLTLDCPTRLPDEAETLTAALGEQLAPLGIQLDVTLHADREAYAHKVRRSEIGDLCVFDSSPVSTFRVLYEKIDARIAGSWWQGYRNPDVQARLDTARVTTDMSARSAIYSAIFHLLRDDPPWLALYTPLQSAALAPHDGHFAMPDTAILDVTRLPRFTG